MLFGNIILDLVGPLIVSSILFFEVVAVMLEAVIIYFLLEREAVKAFVASFSANLITGLLNIIYLFIFWQDVSIYTRKAAVMTVALLINILVEALVIKRFYKTVDNRKILGVSTLMNLASYGVLLLLV